MVLDPAFWKTLRDHDNFRLTLIAHVLFDPLDHDSCELMNDNFLCLLSLLVPGIGKLTVLPEAMQFCKTFFLLVRLLQFNFDPEKTLLFRLQHLQERLRLASNVWDSYVGRYFSSKYWFCSSLRRRFSSVL